jgi:hypothetical protein
MQPDDLRGAARDAYDMWRNTFGLSEQSAMRALEQDGAIPLSEDEKLARRFQNIFGLSESEARHAVPGHGGSSERPVSETAGRPSAGPQPGDAVRLVRRIEELAADMCRCGVSEEKALREAAFQVFRAAPDGATQEWVAQVTGRRWPGLWGRRGSSSSKMQRWRDEWYGSWLTHKTSASTSPPTGL